MSDKAMREAADFEYAALAHEYAEANEISVEQARSEITGLGLVKTDPPAGVRKRISVAERSSKHRMIRIRAMTGKPVAQFNATKCPSWIAKPKRRAKSKAAKAARKANR